MGARRIALETTVPPGAAETLSPRVTIPTNLVAEFIGPKKSVHFQFYKGSYYPKKCKVYSFSY